MCKQELHQRQVFTVMELYHRLTASESRGGLSGANNSEVSPFVTDHTHICGAHTVLHRADTSKPLLIFLCELYFIQT